MIDDLNASPWGDSSVRELLAVGRSLVESGSLAEAVAAYDQAHRLAPDPALAEKILRLRRDAAPSASSEPGPSAWPPALSDPFPGLVELPEVEPGALSAAVLGGAILHHGGVIVRGFLEPADARDLCDRSARSILARDRVVAGASMDGDEDWYRPFHAAISGAAQARSWQKNTGGMLMADAPSVMWEVLEIVRRTGVGNAIRGYLQEAPLLSFKKSVLRQVSDPSPTWHQDGSFMGGDVRAVDLWIALSDCGAGTSAPGLDVVPMRVGHILDTQTHGAIFPHSIGQGLVDEVAADRPWSTPTFAAGDAILFDERFVHRSSVGDYSAQRYAIESWFFAPSTMPDDYGPLLC